MIEQKLFLQTPDAPAAMISGMCQTAGLLNVQELDVAVAYATKGGCELLARRLSRVVPNWRAVRKRWLISINGCVTEPEALRYLRALSNSEVRVPNMVALLQNRGRGSDLFHCKIFFFEAVAARQIAIFSGSPNLTASGLLSNTEQGHSVVLKPAFTPAERRLRTVLQQEKQTLRQTFLGSPVLTDALINRYAQLPRPRFRPDNTSLFNRVNVGQTVADPATDLSLATAQNLWVQIRSEISNTQVGAKGSQMDGQKGMRVFFGESPAPVEKNHIFGEVRLRINGSIYDGTLKFGNNGMDKLNLPPCDNPGPATYVNKTVLFTRRADSGFDVTVGAGSVAAAWERQSDGQGTAFEMRGGRRWGHF